MKDVFSTFLLLSCITGGYALLPPRSDAIERSTAPAITAQPASSWSGGTSPMISGVSAAGKTISLLHIMLASEAEVRRGAEKGRR